MGKIQIYTYITYYMDYHKTLTHQGLKFQQVSLGIDQTKTLSVQSTIEIYFSRTAFFSDVIILLFKKTCGAKLKKPVGWKRTFAYIYVHQR